MNYFCCILDCCCSKLDKLLQQLSTQEDKQKKEDEKIMTELSLLKESNDELTLAIQNNGKKLDKILEADSRVRALTMPDPNLPSAFIELLPASTIKDLEIVESLISQNSAEMLTLKDELVITLIYRILFKSIVITN